MALPKCEGPIVVPTGGWSFTLTDSDHGGGSSLTVPAGTYYLTTSNGANDPFLTEFASTLSDGAGVTYTVTVDDNSDTSTGKVTITSSDLSSFVIEWTSTDLRDVLGFAGDVSAQDTSDGSVTGANQARYLWLPSVGRTRVLAPEPSSTTYELGLRRTDATHAKSPDGRSVRLVYNTTYVDTFEFDLLTANKVYQHLESTVNESFEKFFDDVFAEGLQFRYHSDRSDDTLFWTQVLEDANGTDGHVTPAVEAWRHGSSSLWSIRYRMAKAVGE